MPKVLQEIMCLLSRVENVNHGDVSLGLLQNHAPISEDRLYEYCFLWSTDLSSPLCFLNGHGQIFHWLSTLAKTWMGGMRCFLLLKRKRENWVAFFRALIGVDDV